MPYMAQASQPEQSGPQPAGEDSRQAAERSPESGDAAPKPVARDDALTRLALAAAKGDQAAYRELDERLRPALTRMYVARVGANRELSEDLAQRAMVGVWEALNSGRFDPTRASIATYGYAVAHRVWLVHARKISRMRSMGDQDANEEDTSGAGERDPDMSALLEAIRDCIAGRTSAVDQLNEEDRWLLVAIGRGVTDRELAKRLGIAPSSAHGRKRSALAALSRALVGMGFSGQPPSQDAAERGGATRQSTSTNLRLAKEASSKTPIPSETPISSETPVKESPGEERAT